MIWLYNILKYTCYTIMTNTKRSSITDLINKYIDDDIKMSRSGILKPENSKELKSFKNAVFDDIYIRLRSTKITEKYLNEWTKEFCFPDDVSRWIIENREYV